MNWINELYQAEVAGTDYHGVCSGKSPGIQREEYGWKCHTQRRPWTVGHQHAFVQKDRDVSARLTFAGADEVSPSRRGNSPRYRTASRSAPASGGNKPSLTSGTKAHVAAQRWIEGVVVGSAVTALAGIREIHRRFCELLPPGRTGYEGTFPHGARRTPAARCAGAVVKACRLLCEFKGKAGEDGPTPATLTDEQGLHENDRLTPLRRYF